MRKIAQASINYIKKSLLYKFKISKQNERELDNNIQHQKTVRI